MSCIKKTILLIVILGVSSQKTNAFPCVDIAGVISETIIKIEDVFKSSKGIQSLVAMMQQLAELQSIYNNARQFASNVGNFASRLRRFNVRNLLSTDSLRNGSFFSALGIKRDPSSPLYRLNTQISTDLLAPINWQMNNINASMDIVANYNAGKFLRNVASGVSDEQRKQEGRQRFARENLSWEISINGLDKYNQALQDSLKGDATEYGDGTEGNDQTGVVVTDLKQDIGEVSASLTGMSIRSNASLYDIEQDREQKRLLLLRQSEKRANREIINLR